jgi:transglutaminase-like putative cysteine protease
MSRVRRAVYLGIVGCGAIAVFALWPVQTRQGINYEVQEHTIPLYIKLGRFVMRDIEQRRLVRTIVGDMPGSVDAVERLYAWVRARIHAGTPEGLSVIDDHVWHIIVRGYGEADQVADVLATLCTYAGMPARVLLVGPPGAQPVHAITMVYLEEAWRPVDAFYGVLLRSESGVLLSQDAWHEQRGTIQVQRPDLRIGATQYAEFMTWVSATRTEDPPRAYQHMLGHRLWIEIRRMLGFMPRLIEAAIP